LVSDWSSDVCSSDLTTVKEKYRKISFNSISLTAKRIKKSAGFIK